MIVILDYGIGNVRSIGNMLTKVGAPNKISGDLTDVRAADKLILPGVGAFDNVIAAFAASNLRPEVEDKVRGGTPILGICVGMQMLARKSEEGSLPGLGWIEGDVLRFRTEETNLRVPHMGWNDVEATQPHPLSNGLAGNHDHARFYFAHSYHFQCDTPQDILLTCHYGKQFTVGCGRGNIMGVQFHPEKSHKFGMRLLDNFAKLAMPAAQSRPLISA